MSSAKREIGRLLTDRLSELPEDIDTREFICGCFREDLRSHDGIVWAYTRLLGFHDPRVEHPSEGEIAARAFIGGLGEGGAC